MPQFRKRPGESQGGRLSFAGRSGARLRWQDLPQFGNVAHQDALRRFIMVGELEVLTVDPAYMCIGDVDHGNLFEVGAARAFPGYARKSASLLILAHHTRRRKIDPFSARVGRYCMVWVPRVCPAMVARRAAGIVQPGSGQHRLWLSAGGSAGHSDLWAVDIAEDTKTPGGRFWQVEVLPATKPDNRWKTERSRQRNGPARTARTR